MPNDPCEFDRALVESALKACQRSYAPYSEAVSGAAVLDSEGRIHIGCTVEVATYTGTVHAEQVAIAAALAAGAKRLLRIAVYPSQYPCGVCRQFMLEFNEQFVVVNDIDGKIVTAGLGDLMPNLFGRKTMQLPGL